jgi:hypothetical protein
MEINNKDYNLIKVIIKPNKIFRKIIKPNKIIIIRLKEIKINPIIYTIKDKIFHMKIKIINNKILIAIINNLIINKTK